MIRPLTLAAALAAICLPAQAESLDAHVHGHAKVTLAVDDAVVTVELEAPLASVVGFETEPATDEERKAMTDAEATLNEPETLFTFPAAAGCEPSETEVEVEREDDHAEFHATYTFRCSDPAALSGVETALMERFEKMEEIDVEFATPAGQGAVELEGDQRQVSFTQ